MAAKKKAKKVKLVLTPGRFYRAKDGQIWCCFRTRQNRGPKDSHAAADCIRVVDQRVEYFYIDGRYDALVEEVRYGDVQDL